MRRLFTSESVTEGHPDKLCDQVSDAVLDAILTLDPVARVACETVAATGIITVMGEITTDSYVDINAIVRKTVTEIGYDSPEKFFNGNTCAIMTAIHDQSPDIAMGVNDALETRGAADAELGAGDQGMMFGYACNETPEKMPLPIALSHRMALQLARVRKDGTLPWLYPDGKTQVTVAYEDGTPVAVDTVVVSAQHAADVDMEILRDAILSQVILPVIPEKLLTSDTRMFINPTGRFVIGGPAGDTGLTGRKIIVDTFGTGKLPDDRLAELVGRVFDFRPSAIIRRLDLRRPIYRQTAAYGHFGRTDIDLPWEKEDMVETLRSNVSTNE